MHIYLHINFLQDERKDTPVFIHRNDIPVDPKIHIGKTDFGDGQIIWKTAPFSDTEIDSWEKRCNFNEVPSLSAKAKDLGFEGEMNGFNILKAIITDDVINK